MITQITEKLLLATISQPGFTSKNISGLVKDGLHNLPKINLQTDQVFKLKLILCLGRSCKSEEPCAEENQENQENLIVLAGKIKELGTHYEDLTSHIEAFINLSDSGGSLKEIQGNLKKAMGIVSQESPPKSYDAIFKEDVSQMFDLAWRGNLAQWTEKVKQYSGNKEYFTELLLKQNPKRNSPLCWLIWRFNEEPTQTILQFLAEKDLLPLLLPLKEKMDVHDIIYHLCKISDTWQKIIDRKASHEEIISLKVEKLRVILELYPEVAFPFAFSSESIPEHNREMIFSHPKAIQYQVKALIEQLHSETMGEIDLDQDPRIKKLSECTQLVLKQEFEDFHFEIFSKLENPILLKKILEDLEDPKEPEEKENLIIMLSSENKKEYEKKVKNESLLTLVKVFRYFECQKQNTKGVSSFFQEDDKCQKFEDFLTMIAGNEETLVTFNGFLSARYQDLKKKLRFPLDEETIKAFDEVLGKIEMLSPTPTPTPISNRILEAIRGPAPESFSKAACQP